MCFICLSAHLNRLVEDVAQSEHEVLRIDL